MPSKDAIRRADNLAFLAGGAEYTFGDPAALPLPVSAFAALRADHPGVEAVCASGLTAVVYKLRVGAACYAVKQARPQCLVRNDDGRTSFLNELQRHAELAALRAGGARLPGVVAPLYGSLRAGVLVSPWIEGEQVDAFDRRRFGLLLESGRALLEHGFFEWDFSPGNLLDDGRQVWLFDFGYMYRFDPLHELNSAGDGRDLPRFHLAERIETRAAFAWLLALERRQGKAAALAQFAVLKELAAEHYGAHRARLAERGADALVLGQFDGLLAQWRPALGDAALLETLYLREAWRSHTLDLFDDLCGRTCTPATLARADWLLEQAFAHYDTLLGAGALDGDDAHGGRDELMARYRGHRASAERYQLARRRAD